MKSLANYILFYFCLEFFLFQIAVAYDFEDSIVLTPKRCSHSCIQGGCSYKRCNKPQCPGGACYFLDCINPSCTGKALIIVYGNICWCHKIGIGGACTFDHSTKASCDGGG